MDRDARRRPFSTPLRSPRRCRPTRPCSSSSARPTFAPSAGSPSNTTRSSSAIPIQGPGGDAAVIRLGDGPKGLALTTDCTERYCARRPARRRQAGGRGGVAQPDRRRRAAARADRQSQFRQSREAAGDGRARRLHRGHRRGGARARFSRSFRATCRSTTRRWARHSADAGDRRRRPHRRRGEGGDARLQGGGRGHPADRRRARLARPLGLARDGRGREEGAPPPVDLAAERRNGEFVASLIRERQVSAVHDLSDGGLAVALAEMAIAGGIGATIDGRAAPSTPSSSARIRAAMS